MKKCYEIKKKHCISFENFALDLWIIAKHNDYWYYCAKYDIESGIDVWEETYSCTMVISYDYWEYKEWNFDLLDNEILKNKWI